MGAAGLEEGDPPKERREEEARGLGWMLLALLIKGGDGQTKEGVSGGRGGCIWEKMEIWLWIWKREE